jgi:hypothetical protein
MREAFDRYARNRPPNLCGDSTGTAKRQKTNEHKHHLQRKTNEGAGGLGLRVQGLWCCGWKLAADARISG